MKQRIITAVLGLILFFAILFCFDTIILDVAVLIISLIAVHELLLATKLTKFKTLSTVTMFMSVLPFLKELQSFISIKYNISYIYILIIVLVIGSMFLILLKQHEKLKFSQITLAFFIGMVVPVAFSSIVGIRNILINDNDSASVYYGVYLLILVFAVSWGADSGAYFAGRFFGKKKLAPKISPNKTVEGVYGGVLSSIFFVALVTACFYIFMNMNGYEFVINYIPLLIWAIIGSLVGVVGDLSASVIKRQYEIKDFGSIFPGHGGILDRFDSVLFVAPLLLSLLRLFMI